MSIVNDCMIVNLQIGIWMGYRLDKEASSRITRDANAHDDAARVNKHLIPKELLKPVISASNAVRTHFYDKTLPWKDNGDRLLTRKLYTKFIEEHARLVGDFNAAVETFLSRDYNTAKERAGFRMGELFNPNDYPSSRELQRRFYCNLDIDPVSQANDFRVDLNEAEVDRIRKQMEAAMRDRLGTAMADVWHRVATTLGHFAEKMAGKDQIFRDSTVRNLQEIVELLPDLNIMDDANLDRIRNDISKHLTGYEPKELRNNPANREAAATEAKRIMDEMAGFMNAFKGAAQ